jgi:cytochrome c553
MGAGDVAGAFPVIAGQPAPYLYETLRAFALGDRESGFMQPPAHRYAPDVLAELALYFAAQPAPVVDIEPVARPIAGLPTSASQDAAGILEGEGDLPYGSVPLAAGKGPPSTPEEVRDLGRRIALEGIDARKVPACQSCHGRAGQAQNPLYPYLAGQHEWYLSEHLRLWREGERGGTRLAHVMRDIAEGMTDEQIKAVSAWYASLAIAQ